MAFMSAVALSVFGLIIRYRVAGDNIAEPAQTVLISLTTTLYAYITGLFTGIVYRYKKYADMAGTYTGYAYKNEDDVGNIDFYQIKGDPQSVAILDYVGGTDFRIQVSINYPPELNDLVWVGDFTITSSNTASIGWWYTNDRVKYEIGHKRAVLINDIIVLFSDGTSIHGREVFIKDKKLN